jgi:hypothetical protein
LEQPYPDVGECFEIYVLPGKDTLNRPLWVSYSIYEPQIPAGGSSISDVEP